MLERWGLKLHLALIFALATAVLGGALGIVIGQWVKDDKAQLLSAQLSELAAEIGDGLEHGALDQSEMFRLTARQFKGDPAAASEWVASHLKHPEESDYDWMAILDANGRVMESTRLDLVAGQDFGAAPWFIELSNSATMNASLVETDRGLLVTAVIPGDDGRPAGMLVGRLSRLWLARQISRGLLHQGENSDADVIVLDGRGHVLTAPVDLPTLPRPALGAAGLAQAIRWPDGMDYLTASTERLSPWAEIGVSWRVVARRDLVRAMASANQLRWRIWMLAAVLSALGALVGGLAAMRVSRPLEQIADAALRIGAGEQSVRIPQISYFREVATLSVTLRNMVAAMRGNEMRLTVLNEVLDQRVRERTLEYVQAHEALQHQEARLRTLIEHALDGVLVVTADGRIETFNPACERMFGWLAGDVVGTSAACLMPESAWALYFNDPHDALSGLSPERVEPMLDRTREIKGRRRDGSLFPMELSLTQVRDQGVPFYIALLRDVSEQVQARERLTELATTDSLTGVRNRRAFFDLAEKELSRARRHGRSLVVMLIDADYFKSINDTFGHAAGDAVLRQLAKLASVNLREMDVVGRLGGEEFAICMPEASVTAGCMAAERLRHLVAGMVVQAADGAEVRCSISVGVAEAHEDDGTIEDILRRADAALYRAKNLGRNRVECAVGPIFLAEAAD